MLSFGRSLKVTDEISDSEADGSGHDDDEQAREKHVQMLVPVVDVGLAFLDLEPSRSWLFISDLIRSLPSFLPTLKKGIQPVPIVISE